MALIEAQFTEEHQLRQELANTHLCLLQQSGHINRAQRDYDALLEKARRLQQQIREAEVAAATT